MSIDDLHRDPTELQPADSHTNTHTDTHTHTHTEASADGAPKILVERAGPVTTIVINRPHVRNALDREATALLAAAFRAFEADPEAKVAVLYGAGGAFCAGADLKELASGVAYDAWAGLDGPLARPLSKPVIAAVAGHACAGGLGVALWCDLRVVEQSASFAVLSRRWGVPMSDGTTVRLPRLIGASRALDMLLTARLVGADEALAMGLANRVVPDATSRAAAEALAAVIAGFPGLAMRSDRQSVHQQDGLSMRDALANEEALAAEAKRIEASAGAARFAAGAGRHGAVAGTSSDGAQASAADDGMARDVAWRGYPS